MKLVVATHNEGKLVEIHRILEEDLGADAAQVELVSAGSLGLPDPETMLAARRAQDAPRHFADFDGFGDDGVRRSRRCCGRITLSKLADTKTGFCGFPLFSAVSAKSYLRVLRAHVRHSRGNHEIHDGHQHD